jgi:hypothetical protein
MDDCSKQCFGANWSLGLFALKMFWCKMDNECSKHCFGAN